MPPNSTARLRRLHSALIGFSLHLPAFGWVALTTDLNARVDFTAILVPFLSFMGTVFVGVIAVVIYLWDVRHNSHLSALSRKRWQRAIALFPHVLVVYWWQQVRIAEGDRG